MAAMNIVPIAAHSVPTARETARSMTTAVSAGRSADVVLDLSRGSRDVLGAVLRLDREQLQEFLRITAELLRHGVVGVETLEVRDQPYKSFLPAHIADPVLRDAPLYRGQPRAGAAASLDLHA